MNGKRHSGVLSALIALTFWLAFLLPLQAMEECTVTVNGQRVFSGPIGSRFRVTNVPVTGDLVRACVICKDADGQVLYGQTHFFEITNNETYLLLDDIDFADTPPQTVRFLRVDAGVPVLTDPTVQLQVFAKLPDNPGVEENVTQRMQGTTYRSSNPDIAAVSRNGLVTAVARGRVVISATNSGATATVRIDISPGDPLTSVSGVVIGASGQPTNGARIQMVGVNGTTTTTDDGSFVIENVATNLNAMGLTVLYYDAGFMAGVATGFHVMPEAITDAGIIQLSNLGDLDDDEDGIDDTLEELLGFDPTTDDSDEDGVVDGDEDEDQDGAPDWAEVFLGIDDNAQDSDLDGLSDLVELTLSATDLFDDDTDGDLFSDGEEFNDHSSPLDNQSIPPSIGSGRLVSVHNRSISAHGIAIGQTISISNSSASANGVAFGQHFTVTNESMGSASP